MPNALKIATGFLLASIATIFINGPMILLFFKINDIFLLGSLSFFIIAIFKNNINVQQNKKLYLFFIVWFCLNIIGTVINYIIFKHLDYIIILKEYGRMIACFLIFIEIVTITKYNQNLPKWILFTLIIPSIITPLLYFIPQNYMHNFEYINGTYIRFKGLFESPNAYAQFMIIPTILLTFFILNFKQYNKQKNILIIISFLMLCLSVGTIIWSGSRSGIIGLIVSFAILIFFLIRSSNIKKIIFGLIIIILSFPIGSFILPKESQEHIKSRITVITADRILKTEPTKIKTEENKDKKIENTIVITQQSRPIVWRNSLNFIIKNPLGYGPESYTNINIIDNNGGFHMGSHNIILQLILSGGLILFLYTCIILFKLLRNTINKYKKTFNETSVLLSIFLGIITASLFEDLLYARWLWVIIALIYSYDYCVTLFQSSQKQ